VISSRCRIIYLTSESALASKCWKHLNGQRSNVRPTPIAPVVSAEAVSGLMAHNGEKHE
jgi:hypothetical protein